MAHVGWLGLRVCGRLEPFYIHQINWVSYHTGDDSTIDIIVGITYRISHDTPTGISRDTPTSIMWSRSVRWCLAVGLACGDQRRLTGSSSALEALRDDALYKSTYFTIVSLLCVAGRAPRQRH